MSAIQPTNILQNAITSRVIDRVPLQDDHRDLRIRLMAGQILVSLLANGSFIPITLRANLFLSIGDFISFTALDVWAIRGTLRDVMGPATPHELTMYQRNALPLQYKVALTVAAVGLAILGRSPAALPAIQYLGSLGYPAAVTLYLQGANVSTRSMQLMICRIIQKRKLASDVCGKKMELLRAGLGGKLSNYRLEFQRMTRAEQLAQVALFKEIRALPIEGRFHKFISTLLIRPARIVADRGGCWNTMSHIGRGSTLMLGIFFVAIMQIAGMLISFVDTEKYVTSNDLGAGLLTTVTVMTGIYVAIQSVMGTTQRFANSFFGLLLGHYERGIADQLRPLESFGSKALGLVCNVGTFGSTIVVWGDFFEGSSTKNLFVYAGGLSFFLLTATATLDLVDEMIEDDLLKNGTPEEKSIVQHDRDASQVKTIIENVSLQDLCLFIHHSPIALKTALLEEVDLPAAALETYISQKWPIQIPATEMA